ncbi:MAG: PIG-L deacetylase family protein [Chloroflexota bacterium]|jgi:LmbE family N-acetylglucosaminyl deacetylase
MNLSGRRLLAVLAHPDDESYGMGGTLARYSREGVDVHLAIATDGAAGSIDPKWQGDRSRLAEARAAELRRASEILGVQVHMLGYRDSGYIGDPAGEHPRAWVNADKNEAVGRVVGLIRQLRPDVLVTHDETGGYYHPDHIQCCTIVTAAFHAAGDPAQYPEIGPGPFRPARFYYSAFSNRWVRFLMIYMRLKGQDPTRAGRNQDIDYTRIGLPPEKITTTVDYRPYWDLKIAASAEHGSQGGGTSFSRMFPSWLQKRLFGYETYIRVYPPLPPGRREKGLFEGLNGQDKA